MYPLGALRAIANGRLMLLDSTELGRLAMIHKYPQLYIERRTETMAVNFPFYRMTVLQQFTLPMNDYPDDGVPRQVYVPLGSTYTVQIRYSEHFEYRKSGAPSHFLSFLSWFGIASASVRRQVANRGKAHSLWIMASLPESIEAVRFFWYGRRNSREEPLQDIVDCELPVIGDHAIARRNPAVQGALDGRLVLDVQLKPSSGILTAIGLAMFIVFVSTYIYQRIPELTAQDSARNAVLAVPGMLSALPAALARGLAQRSHA